MKNDYGNLPMQPPQIPGSPLLDAAPGQQIMRALRSPGQQPPMQRLPSQEELDDMWRRSPTDGTGEMIDQIIQNSGGALQAPWDRGK